MVDLSPDDSTASGCRLHDQPLWSPHVGGRGNTGSGYEQRLHLPLSGWLGVDFDTQMAPSLENLETC